MVLRPMSNLSSLSKNQAQTSSTTYWNQGINKALKTLSYNKHFRLVGVEMSQFRGIAVLLRKPTSRIKSAVQTKGLIPFFSLGGARVYLDTNWPNNSLL